MYGIVDDIVMVSGDISVFWQEIIDSYRDIMIVKNSDKAKSYLDLTDVEYSRLKSIASQVTPARLSYHVSLLEDALSDMQRAFNSKRSIAEIVLTRMCDPKLIITAESLAVRLEELERDISMMKLGVPQVQQKSAEQVKAQAPDIVTPADLPEPTNDSSSEGAVIYSRWGSVIERICALKKSLSAGIASASVYKCGESAFLIVANDFFAKKLAASEADLAIVRGVIAEVEGKPRDTVKLEIRSLDKPVGDVLLELSESLK